MCLKVNILLQIYPFSSTGKSKASQKALIQFSSNRSLFFFSHSLHEPCTVPVNVLHFIGCLPVSPPQRLQGAFRIERIRWKWVQANNELEHSRLHKLRVSSGIANTHRTSAEERGSGSSLPLTSFPFVYPFYHLYIIPLNCNKRK